jgi:hypothetical protein
MIPVVGAIGNAVAHAIGKRVATCHHFCTHQGGPQWLTVRFN